MKYQSFILNGAINFFNQNIVTFLAVVFFTFINGQVYIMAGNLIWLQIGAISLCYLLFGYRVLIAVFCATQFSSYWFHGLELAFFPTGMVNLIGCSNENFLKLLTRMKYKYEKKENTIYFKYISNKSKKIFKKFKTKNTDNPFKILSEVNFK